MKQFLLGYLPSALIIPTLSMAQTAQLTEQLGKTVLYGDITMSPDGSHVAWVQSTAATTSKQTYIQATSGNSSAALVNLEAVGERIDADPVWSPDAKTVAFFSTAGEKEQRQLWSVNADGSKLRKLSHLKGYAARPRWSHDGTSIAFIEGLMSDEGFHGGDLFTISADGHDILNRTEKRNSSASSLFWLTPDRILLTEIVGGESTISELALGNNSVRTIWKRAEHIHAFDNFPNFALSKDGKFAAVDRYSHEMPT